MVMGSMVWPGGCGRRGVAASGDVRTVVCYAVRMNVRTNLMLPEELVAAIDEVAGPRGRSRYVADTVAKQIRRDLLMAAVTSTAGLWKDHPLFPTDESVVEWVREGRRATRDPWAEPSS
jgi:hypothetical protein